MIKFLLIVVVPAIALDLIPVQKTSSHQYYTTWATQGYMPGIGAQNLTIDWIFKHQGGYQQAVLNSTFIFGADGVTGSGWARDFYPQSRGELYFMLDQGYATGDSSIEINTKHFPEFNSSDPAQNLIMFQKKIQALGWRGLGLWNRVTKPADAAKYASWSKAANITYWKIDGPDLSCACQQAAQEVFPELVIEHGFCPVSGCPLNNPTGSKVLLHPAFALTALTALTALIALIALIALAASHDTSSDIRTQQRAASNEAPRVL
jgi:hypothetical protein